MLLKPRVGNRAGVRHRVTPDPEGVAVTACEPSGVGPRTEGNRWCRCAQPPAIFWHPSGMRHQSIKSAPKLTRRLTPRRSPSFISSLIPHHFFCLPLACPPASGDDALDGARKNRADTGEVEFGLIGGPFPCSFANDFSGAGDIRRERFIGLCSVSNGNRRRTGGENHSRAHRFSD